MPERSATQPAWLMGLAHCRLQQGQRLCPRIQPGVDTQGQRDLVRNVANRIAIHGGPALSGLRAQRAIQHFIQRE